MWCESLITFNPYLGILNDLIEKEANNNESRH